MKIISLSGKNSSSSSGEWLHTPICAENGDSFTQLIARTPFEDNPRNSKMAKETFLDIVARQKERGNPVFDSFAFAMQSYKKYSHSTNINSLLIAYPSNNLEALPTMDLRMTKWNSLPVAVPPTSSRVKLN